MKRKLLFIILLCIFHRLWEAGQLMMTSQLVSYIFGYFYGNSMTHHYMLFSYRVDYCLLLFIVNQDFYSVRNAWKNKSFLRIILFFVAALPTSQKYSETRFFKFWLSRDLKLISSIIYKLEKYISYQALIIHVLLKILLWGS